MELQKEAYELAKANLRKVCNELKEEYSKKIFNATWDEVVAMENQEWLQVSMEITEDQRFKVAFDTFEVAEKGYKGSIENGKIL